MMPRIGDFGLVAIIQNQINESDRAKTNARGWKCPTKPGSSRTACRANRAGQPKTIALQTTQQTVRKKVKVIMPNQSNALAAPRRSVPTPGTARRTSGGRSNSAAELRSSTSKPRMSKTARNESPGKAIACVR